MTLADSPKTSARRCRHNDRVSWDLWSTGVFGQAQYRDLLVPQFDQSEFFNEPKLHRQVFLARLPCRVRPVTYSQIEVAANDDIVANSDSSYFVQYSIRLC